MTLLIKNLTKSYGAVVAVDNVSLELHPGRIYSLIGPNGAGKSTMVNLMAGSYTATGGEILLDGKNLVGLKKHQINARGVARTYQNIRLFDRMTVRENLEVCYYPVAINSVWKELFLWRSAEKQQRLRHRECDELLARFDLQDYADEPAERLPYGQQRMLEIARALVRGPRLLLLDEPAAGLNEVESRILKARLRTLRRPDLIMLIIEHDMELVMSLSDHVFVMHNGRLLHEGTPDQVRGDERVQDAYLGTDDEIEHIRDLSRRRKAERGLRAQDRSS